MTRKMAVVAVIGSAACFATLGVLTKVAFANGADPQSLLMWRFAVAAVILATVQLARSPRDLLVTRGDLVSFGLMALSGYAFASMCYSFAVRDIGASVSTVLLYTYPAIVCVLGRIFLSEPFPPRRLAAVALSFAGCALVADLIGSAGAVSVAGLLLGLGAGLGYAVFNVVSYRVLGRRPRTVIMAYMFAMSAILIAAGSLITSGWPSTSAWTPGAWAAMGLMVLLPTFVAVALYLASIRSLGAPQAALLSTLELPFTILLASALMSERLDALQWLGAVLVLAGVVLAEWGAVPAEMDAVPTL